jgi:hypothetical protein
MKVNMVGVFCIHNENRRMKPVEIILEGWGRKENDGGDKSN